MESLGRDTAILDVAGKKVAVPAGKIDAAAKPGDKVVWSGQQWIRVDASFGVPRLRSKIEEKRKIRRKTEE